MIKRISTIFFSFCFSVATVLAGFTLSTNASTTYIISTPLEFCEYNHTSIMKLVGSSSVDCAGYSDEVGAELITQNGLRIDWGDVVILKDMNLTYDFIRSPFGIYDGKLIIDGGTYKTSGSCLLTLSGSIDAEKRFEIISGDFIAEGGRLRYSQTPICFINPTTDDKEIEAEQIRKALAPNSYFSEYNTDTEIIVEENLARDVDFFGKDVDEVNEISTINRTRFSVRERQEPEPITPSPEPEQLPEPEPEIIIEDTPAIEQIIIPKAPNTGSK